LRFATHARQPVFQDWRAARVVVRALQERHARGEAQSWAFVVMPDHVHWLCGLGTKCSLPELVGRVKSRVTIKLRKRNLAPKELWQDGFFDRALRREEDMPAAARYLVSDPVRSGLVTSLGDYPHWDAVWI